MKIFLTAADFQRVLHSIMGRPLITLIYKLAFSGAKAPSLACTWSISINHWNSNRGQLQMSYSSLVWTCIQVTHSLVTRSDLYRGAGNKSLWHATKKRRRKKRNLHFSLAGRKEESFGGILGTLIFDRAWRMSYEIKRECKLARQGRPWLLLKYIALVPGFLGHFTFQDTRYQEIELPGEK